MLDVYIDELFADLEAQTEQLRQDFLVRPDGSVLVEDLPGLFPFDSSADVWRRSVERLADVLDADQLAVMQRFVEQMENFAMEELAKKGLTQVERGTSVDVSVPFLAALTRIEPYWLKRRAFLETLNSESRYE